MKKQTAKKTPLETPSRKSYRGGQLRTGNPGNKGGTGRPPDAFKELCRELATGEKTVAQLRLILQSKKDPQFMQALRWASEHGYGKPAQPLEHNVGKSLADLFLTPHD